VTTLFYRHWRILVLAIGLVLATGVAALLTIGRQEDPTITNLFATIVTPYPGAAPARVEALVTEKIEEELRAIPEIDTISSTSRTGVSVIQIELSAFIDDATIEQTWSEIRDALADAAVHLPEGVPEPELDDDRTGAYTVISALRAAPGIDPGDGILRRYAEILQDDLRRLPATQSVRLFGARDEQILVEIDARRLASLGLDAGALAAAIGSADAKVRAGQMRGEDADLLLEVEGEIETLERIGAIPLRTEQGSTVRVGDVAGVRRGVVEPAGSLAYADGVPAVLIAARMENDLQIDRYRAAVHEVLERFESQLPRGLELDVVFDQSTYTSARLAELGGNLMIGMALVVVVLLLTLGWRAALVVACLLPLTGMLSIAVLDAAGVPIQQMSVTGLIVALGLLVDAAIVMTDEIRRRLADGLARVDAVGGAVRRLAAPLLAATLTTVLAFMPMALLPGPAGDFVGSIAISVIVMLSASFVLALTVTPALAGYLLPDPARGGNAWWQIGVHSRAVARAFVASLDLALRYPKLAVLGALILPVMGFAAFPTLTAQFFPGVDRDQLYVQLKRRDGESIEAARRSALAAGRIIAADPDVRHVHWVIGESAPAFYYNMKMDQDGVASFAEALVTTASADATPDAVARLQAALDRALPEAQVIVRGLVQGPPVDAPVEVRILGPDLDVLRRLGDQLRERLAAVPTITHARTTLLGGAPKLVLDLDEDQVKQAGLDLGTVAAQLEATLEGAVGGSLLEGTEELPVRVRVQANARAEPGAIRTLEVVAANAGEQAASGAYPAVPLAALGEVSLVPADSPISRRDGERVNTVQGFVAQGVLPEEALAGFEVELAAAPLALPPGYRLAWGGDSDARAETVTNLMSSVGVIIALTVATIVLTFNSFRLSLIAGLVSVLAMGLSILALAVFRYPFGINALIGVIGSIGVSINAAIIIMTGLQEDARAMAGDRVAVRDVVLGTSRHIVSTTVTTFGGFLPLILAGGDFWPPFAMAIAGGVLLSTLVSFYFTAPMFWLFMASRAQARSPSAQRPRAVALDRAA